MGENSHSTFELEALGVEAEEFTVELFGKDAINNLVKQPRVKFTRPVKRVFVCFDPCAGTKKREYDKRPSDAAIATIASVAGVGHVLIGLESLGFNRTQEIKPYLKKHLEAIRSLPMFEHATIVFDIESGTGMSAGDMQAFVRKHFTNVVMMNEEADGFKPGMPQTKRSKEEMVESFCVALQENMFGIAEDFVSVHQPADKVLEMWRQQGNRYQEETVTTKNGHTSSSYSGKGEKGTEKDDIFNATLRGFNAYRIFSNDAQYQRFWHR